MAKLHTLNRRKLLQTGAALTGASFLPVTMAIGAAPVAVAAVHGSPVENAWNSRLHVALTAAAERGEIEYVFSEGIAGTDYSRALREYAEQGVKFIVGETFPVEREARQVADDYPETTFLMGSSGKPHGENFATYGTWNYDAGYLCGMLAGKLSETGVFGSVGAIPIPEINLLINGFRAGVDAVRPDAKHLINFIGTFFDPPKAREAGLAQIDSGADILFGERIGTADAAKERGIKAVGSLTDYTERYPDTVFANAIWNFDAILAAALADFSAGKKTGNDYTVYGQLAKGGSDISYNSDMIPADAVAEMVKRRAAIIAGEFEVPLNFDEPT